MTATQFERPTFADGAKLRADDLEALTRYARDPLGHHARFEHLPGVVSGLELTVKDSTVIVAPGAFVDGYGQVVPVTEPQYVSIAGLIAAGKPPAERKHPLFVRAVDVRVPPSAGSQACGAGANGRVREGAAFEIGTEGQLAAEPRVQIGEQLNDPRPPWQVKLGDIKVDDKGVVSIDGGVQYAGVVADRIESRGKQLEVRTRDGKLKLLIGDDTFTVSQTASPADKPLLTVDSAGNLKVAGIVTASKFDGPAPPGPAIVAGRAFGPIRLPLPPGFKESDVQPSGGFGAMSLISPQIPLVTKPSQVFANHVRADRMATCWVRTGNDWHSSYTFIVTVSGVTT